MLINADILSFASLSFDYAQDSLRSGQTLSEIERV
jgi:hypothetical protein